MWGIAFVGADIGGLVTLMSPQIAGPGGVALEAPLARVPERADHRRNGRAGEDLSDSTMNGSWPWRTHAAGPLMRPFAASTSLP